MTTNPPALDIVLIPCESSLFVAYGYAEAAQTLAIQFPGKGMKTGDTYHYFEVTPEFYARFQTAESKGKFFLKEIKGHFRFEKQPDPETGIAFGLTQAQEPKYTTGTRDGRLVTRATGNPIPDDEPVFVFRAQDKHALVALRSYALLLRDPEHGAAVLQRIAAFEAFAAAHPERMKAPDTAAA